MSIPELSTQKTRVVSVTCWDRASTCVVYDSHLLNMASRIVTSLLLFRSPESWGSITGTVSKTSSGVGEITVRFPAGTKVFSFFQTPPHRLEGQQVSHSKDKWGIFREVKAAGASTSHFNSILRRS